VRALATEGHEVASHGYGHELVTSQTPRSFREDVQRSKQILEDLTGKSVVGYRAPSFSITDRTPWAFPILAEAGYLYDSSIYKRFRCAAASTSSAKAVPVKTEFGVVWEVPPSTMSVCGFHIPVAGGGYFRLFPYAVSRLCLRQLERQGAQLVVYLHPWEIDPEQPRMEGPVLSKFRHYLNLERTKYRLTCLLEEFVFAPVVEAVRPVADAVRLGRYYQGALATQLP